MNITDIFSASFILV